MICSRCATALPEESRFCMECGAPVLDVAERPAPAAEIGYATGNVATDTRPTSGNVTTDTHPTSGNVATGSTTVIPAAPAFSGADDLLLAQANLLRIRGRWDEAAEQCAEALRRRPKNAAAHSLLGDIYENRGRLDEAIHWYSLALDLNPGSVADRAKLARARELQGARAARVTGSESGTAFSWLRVATIAGMTACLTIVLLAIVISSSERPTVRREPGRQAIRVERGGEGVPAPQVASPTWRRSDPSWTPRERRLLQTLQASPAAAGLRPVDLELDPRSSVATLTLILTPEFQSGARESREDSGVHLQREVYRSATSLVALDPSMKTVHVRVLVPLTDSHDHSAPELAFVASLDAASLGARAEVLAPSDLQSLLRDSWWGPPLTR